MISFLNFEKRGEEFKNGVNFMLENIYKLKLVNYWRNIDKKIFFAL